jgi:dienelactone hydrolase
VVAFTLLLTALFWSHARDPFRRVDFTVRGSGAPPGKAMAVMPKHGGPFPVVVWAHGSGGDLLRDGDELRQIAGLGVATVGFDYDKTNQANFDAQMQALLKFISNQLWAKAEASGWIANSLGAQRTLSFVLRHPEQAPQVMVRLNGGGLVEKAEIKLQKEEVDSGKHPTLNTQHSTSNGVAKAVEPSTFNSQLSTKLWLIHGESDEIFAVGDVRRLASTLEAQGVPVRLSLFPGRGHGFGPDQPLLVRAGAEWCANELGAGPPVPVNVRPSLMWYWLPLGVVLLALGWWRMLRYRAGARSEWADPVGDNVRSRSSEHSTCPAPASVQTAEAAREAGAARWLQWAAGIVTGLALLDTALHLALPRLPVTERTVRWAERLIVRPELKESFQWIAARGFYPSIRNHQSSIRNQMFPPADHSPTLYTLLAHVELATLQRKLADWTVTDDLWQKAVLTPWIEGAANDIRWRRMLWEHLYPRVRRETNPVAAAEIVARQLALRVVVTDEGSSGSTIRQMWMQGVASQAGFERLYVAALRSVGVPARIGEEGRCEFHNGEKWRVAPRPFSESLVASRSGEGTVP